MWEKCLYCRDRKDENLEELLDITANLARRVASLEEQLVDSQNNIEMLGRGVAEVKSSLPRGASNNKAKYPKKLTSDLEKLKALLNTDDANVTLVELTEQLDEKLYLTFRIEGRSFEAGGFGVDHDE